MPSLDFAKYVPSSAYITLCSLVRLFDLFSPVTYPAFPALFFMCTLIQHINASQPYGDSSAPCPQQPHSGVTPFVNPCAVSTLMFLVLSYILHNSSPSSGNAILLNENSFAKCSVLSYALLKSTSIIHRSFFQYFASSNIIFFIISGSVVDRPCRNAKLSLSIKLCLCHTLITAPFFIPMHIFLSTS